MRSPAIIDDRNATPSSSRHLTTFSQLITLYTSAVHHTTSRYALWVHGAYLLCIVDADRPFL